MARVLLLMFWLCAPLVAQAPASPFGIVEGFWEPELACELGVCWERIIFDWAQHQPGGPGDWHTLNVDDRWLKAASACGREVVALLKNTPAWATDGQPGAGLPRGLYLPADDPGNFWARFVRRAAAYYASRGVHRFIIWNEPDIDAGTYGHEFAGSLEEYARLLQVAWQAARAGNPLARVHLAGMTWWHDIERGRRPYAERLLAYLAAQPGAMESGYWFDVFSLHIYFRSESVSDIVKASRSLLRAHGLGDKPVWINETNAAPTDDPAWPVRRPVFQLDLEQQAAFLAQAAALALVADVERVAVYKLLDQGLAPGAESFGILSPLGLRPRPAFRTWQLVARHFRAIEAAQLARTPQTNIVRLRHANGQETLALWARDAQPVQVRVPASAGKALRSDQYGTMTLLRPQAGSYTLNLAAARCNRRDGCAVGGPVTLLVQPAATRMIEQQDIAGRITPLIFAAEGQDD